MKILINGPKLIDEVKVNTRKQKKVILAYLKLLRADTAYRNSFNGKR